MPTSPLTGLHVAVSWLTVTPLPAPRVDMDRRTGAAAIAAAPVVGIALGAVVAAAAFGLAHTRLPALLIGILMVGLLALATRGMHLDGLADTADGLGCYGDPERVRAVMRTGDVGPFGASTLIVVLAVQAVGFAALVDGTDPFRWAQIAFAVAAARVGVVLACRRGLPAANRDGFGALVAGTQGWSIAVWTVLAAAAAVPLGVRAAAGLAVTLLFVLAFTAHCRRRMGGVSGDVLGAVVEAGTALTLVALLV